MITDDLVPVICDGEEVQVSPGYPRIKLWADSVKSVGLDWESLPRISKFIDKRSYQCFNNFHTNPVNLSRIYILEENPTIEIKSLKLREAFIELTKNTYLGKYLQATGQTAEYFQQCNTMISTIPVLSLKRPHDHKKLCEIATAIENYSK